MEPALTEKKRAKRKGPHQRAPGKYVFRRENNDNIDDILVVGAMFPWAETRVFYHALPHRSWRNLQQQLCILHSEGFFTHLTPAIGGTIGLQNKLVATEQLIGRLEGSGDLPNLLVEDPEATKHNKGGLRVMVRHTNMHIYTMASLWGGYGGNLATRKQLIGAEPLDIPYSFTFKGKPRESHLRPDDFGRLQRGPVKDYFSTKLRLNHRRARPTSTAHPACRSSWRTTTSFMSVNSIMMKWASRR